MRPSLTPSLPPRYRMATRKDIFCVIHYKPVMKLVFISLCLGVVLCMVGSLYGQPRFDLLLQGGHVIDTKNGISAVRDVGIKDGKIAAVAQHLDPKEALKAVNVAGLY